MKISLYPDDFRFWSCSFTVVNERSAFAPDLPYNHVNVSATGTKHVTGTGHAETEKEEEVFSNRKQNQKREEHRRKTIKTTTKITRKLTPSNRKTIPADASTSVYRIRTARTRTARSQSHTPTSRPHATSCDLFSHPEGRQGRKVLGEPEPSLVPLLLKKLPPYDVVEAASASFFSSPKTFRRKFPYPISAVIAKIVCRNTEIGSLRACFVITASENNKENRITNTFHSNKTKGKSIWSTTRKTPTFNMSLPEIRGV